MVPLIHVEDQSGEGLLLEPLLREGRQLLSERLVVLMVASVPRQNLEIGLPRQAFVK